MNREVEERIVRMYFDNQDFEKNAKATIDTLGELKNGLNMEESSKGMQVFDKISKSLDFTKSTQGLAKVKSGLRSMEGAMGKMFKIGDAPIREAENVFNNIRGMFTRVVGFDVASRVVSAVEGAFRSLTIQPITAGWSQYESKMDSVKTIMSSTGESIDVVQKHLEDLTAYANKTIYNLSDMTSNLGKFTNNGMKLEDSVKAMQGIANAAADAGQGTQQASMAMYNFSQAIGVGKMTSIDWKSIENANMATQRLKNTFMEMAAANGSLQKEFDETDKKWHYYITKNSKGEVVKDKKKWTEVTTSNFRETLSKDWLDAQSMMHALMVYSGDNIDVDTLKAWGITDPEEIKALEQIGKDALDAATQVRTFTKMMDALRESVQSGWADTFELIFGNVTQGTTFWTNLNNELGGILEKSAEIRNNILKIWAGEEIDTSTQEAQVKEKDELLKQAQERLEALLKDEDIEANEAKINRLLGYIDEYSAKLADLKKNNKGGRNNLKIKNTQKTINEYKQKVKELEKLNKEAAEKQKKRASRQTEIESIKDEIKAYKEEISSLKTTLSYTSDADAYNKQLKNITEKERKMAELQKKLDKLQSEQDKDSVVATEKEIEQLKKEIEELTGEIDEANGKAKSSIVDAEGRTGREILIASIEKIIALAKEVGTTFSEAFHNIFGTMDAQKLFDMTKGIEDAVIAVSKWLHEAGEGEEPRLERIKHILEGVFGVIKIGMNILSKVFNLIKRLAMPVVNALIDAFSGVGTFIASLVNMEPSEALQKIGDKLKEVWEKVKRFFSPQDVYTDQGIWMGKEIPAVTWLKNMWQNLKNIVKTWANENGLGNVYDTLANWWETIKKAFEDGLKTIRDWWNDEDSVGGQLKSLFTSIWTTVSGVFKPETDENGNEIGASPLVKFFENFKTGVAEAYSSVEEWWKNSGITEFFTGIWNTLVGVFLPQKKSAMIGTERREWTEDSPLVQFFNNFKSGVEYAYNQVVTWWKETKIEEFFTGLWNSIAGIFTPKTDDAGNIIEDSPLVKFFNNFKAGVENAYKQVSEWWAMLKIEEFFKGIWDTVAGVFIPKTDENGKIIEDSPIVQFFTRLKTGVDEAFKQVKEWWGRLGISEFFTGIWNTLIGAFLPQKKSAMIGTERREWTEDAPIVKFFNNFRTGAENAFATVKQWWADSKIGDFFVGVWNAIAGIFTPKTDDQGNVIEESPLSKFFNNFRNGVQTAYEEVVKWWKDLGVEEFFVGIWNTVAGVFKPKTDDSGNVVEASPIVQFFNNFWNGAKEAYDRVVEWWNKSQIKEFFGTLWNTLIGVFQPQKKSAMIGTERREWTEASPIVQFFNNFWNGIENAFKSVKSWWETSDFANGIRDFFKDIWNTVGNLFEPEKDELGNTVGDSPIVAFFKNFWKGIEDAFDAVQNWWNDDPVAEGIRSFFEELKGYVSEIFGWFSGLLGGAEAEGSFVEPAAALVSGFKAGLTKIDKSISNTETTPKQTEEKASVFVKIIEAITGFFNAVAEAAKNYTENTTIGKFFESLGYFIDGVLEFLTRVLNWIGRFAHGEATKEDWVQAIVGGFIAVLGYIMNLVSMSTLGNIAAGTQSFGQQFLEIAGGMLLVAMAVSMLSALDTGSMFTAAAVVGVLSVVIGLILSNMNKLAITKSGMKAPETSTERVLKTLINTIGKIGMIATVLSLLPAIIKTIGEVREKIDPNVDLGSDILNIMLGMAALVAGVSLAMAITEKITGGTGLSPVATIKTVATTILVVGMVMAAASGIIALTNALVGDDVDGTVDAINNAAKVLSAIGGAIGGFIGSLFGGGTYAQKADEQERALEKTAEFAEKFDMDKITAISRITSLITMISSDANKVDAGKIEAFGTSMGTFGIGMVQLFDMINGLEDLKGVGDAGSASFKKAEDAIGIIDKLTSAFSNIGGVERSNYYALTGFITELGQDEGYLSNFVESLKKVIAKLGEIDGDGLQFDGVAIVGKLYSAIQDGLRDPKLPAFDGTSIVEGIIASLKLGATAIATVVHEMVQQGINLSASTGENGAGKFQTDSETTDLLGGLLGGSGGFDLTQLSDTITSQFTGEGGLISQMTSAMDGIPSVESVFSDKGWMNFTDENGNTIDIVGGLQDQITELSTAVNDTSFELKITPVFDFATLTPEKLQEAFNTQFNAHPLLARASFDNPTTAPDYTTLQTDLGIADIKTKLDAILLAIATADTNNSISITGLGGHMDNISTAIGDMRLVLDTGVLVGQITPLVDLNLAQRSSIYDRTGVIFTNP